MNKPSSSFYIKYLFCLIAGLVFPVTACEKDVLLSLDESEKDIQQAKELINFQPGIALTFDDSYYEQWIKMLPVLKKYNARATFFISPNYPSPKINYEDKLLELFKAGNEIGVHTLNHPHLSQYLKFHSIKQYCKNEVIPVVHLLNRLGINPTSFSYPYGEYSSEANKYLSRYFSKIRCLFGNPFIKRSNKFIGASAIKNGDLNEYKTDILIAKANNSIWVLTQHKAVIKATANEKFTIALLDSICRFVRDNHMAFYCINELDSLSR